MLASGRIHVLTDAGKRLADAGRNEQSPAGCPYRRRISFDNHQCVLDTTALRQTTLSSVVEKGCFSMRRDA